MWVDRHNLLFPLPKPIGEGGLNITLTGKPRKASTQISEVDQYVSIISSTAGCVVTKTATSTAGSAKGGAVASKRDSAESMKSNYRSKK